MRRLQAFQYELRPDDWQRRQLARFAGSCRFVWNRMLALQKERLDAGQGVRLDQANSRQALPQPGWVRYRDSRPVLER